LIQKIVPNRLHLDSLLVKNMATASEVSKDLRKRSAFEGQALIEYMLVIPLLFVLVVNMVNFGGFFYAWITVANAARGGAQYAVLNSASVGSLTPASSAQIRTLITQDVSSLPNQASLTINVCQNNNGTITTITGTCTGIASDPEPASYVLTSADVTYTYQPFIPLFNFPSLGIHATLPPTAIERRACMRTLR
jgi:Flp pilus assembly protein TadG